MHARSVVVVLVALAAAAGCEPDTSQSPSFTFLFTTEKTKTKFACAADDAMTNSAITFVTPLAPKYYPIIKDKLTTSIVSKYLLPDGTNVSRDLCDFKSASDCVNLWTKGVEQLTDGNNLNLDTITDERWEKFPTYYTDNAEVVSLPFQDRVDLSIRANSEVSILLCKKTFSTGTGTACYWITLDSQTIVRKCSKVNTFSYPDILNSECNDNDTRSNQGMKLSEKTWMHFEVRWEIRGKNVELTVRYAGNNNPIVTYKDANPIDVDGLFLSKPSGRALWKVHEHSFLKINNMEGTEQDIGPMLLADSDNELCVALHVAVCSKCSLQLSLGGKTGTVAGSETRGTGDRQGWRVVRLVTTGSHQLKVRTTGGPTGWWLLDDVRQCHTKEARVIKMEVKKLDPSEVVSCQALEYPDWRAQTKGGIVNATDLPGICSNTSYIGAGCNISCVATVGGQVNTEINCNRYAICIPTKDTNQLQCSCSAGYTGNQCNERCSATSYGYNCKHECHCKNSRPCTSETGECKDGCEDGYFGTQCSSMLPRLTNSPKLISTTLTSIQVRLDDVSLTGEGRANTFQIQYREKGQTSIWTDDPTNRSLLEGSDVTLTGLKPETTYEIRALVWGDHPPYQGDQVKVIEAVTRCDDKLQQSPITNLTFIEQSNGLKIEWVPVCRATFDIHIVCVDNAWCNITNNATSTFSTVDRNGIRYEQYVSGLTPATHYEVRVSLQNQNTIVQSKRITTKDGPPGPVRDLQVYSRSKDYVRIRWRAPYPPNGELDLYKYALTTVKPTSDIVFSNMSPNATPCIPWPDFLCYTINTTFPTQQLYVTVRAKNKGVQDYGQIEQRVFRNEQDRPKAPTKLRLKWIPEEQTFNMTWGHPDLTNGDLQYFQVDIRQVNTGLRQSPIQPNYKPELLKIVDGKLQRQYTYKSNQKLLLASTYEVSVLGRNGAYDGDKTTVPMMTPPPVPTLIEPVDMRARLNTTQLVIIPPPDQTTLTQKSYMYVVVCDLDSVSTSHLPNLLVNLREVTTCTGEIWIAGQLQVDQFMHNFTIGQRSESSFPGSNNIALRSERQYNISVLLVNEYQGQVRHRVYFPKTSVPKEAQAETENGESNSGLYALFLLLLLPVIAYFVYWYVRKRQSNSEVTDLFNLREAPSIISTVLTKFPGQQNRNNTVPENDSRPLLVSKPTTGTSEFSHVVQLNILSEYIKQSLENGELERQHAMFPKGPTKPWEYGMLKENKFKNRYNNITAYDQTRVVLEKLNGDSYSDFINANYIDGYNKKRAYIATQGPKPNTVNDFWRMIWQEKVEHIVMLANIVEGGKKKCTQYWPNINETSEYRDITVRFLDSKVFADFQYKTFEVKYKDETRKIQHHHFTSWPDHGVPLYAQSLVPFLKKLIAISNQNAPMVVHCSAGVGRTGTIILCDICLRMAAKEGAVDVLKYLHSIREQRVNMVDNFDQYKLVHMVLLECLLAPDTKIPCDKNLSIVVNKLISEGVIQKQLKYLEETAWHNQAMNNGVAPNPVNQTKNRFQDIVPDHSRIYISRYPYSDEHSDYINAIPVDGYQNKDQFIVSQSPLPNTVCDFWRMVTEYEVRVIVSLNEINLSDKTSCIFWPADEGEIEPISDLIVKFQSKKLGENYDMYNLQINNKNAEEGAELSSVSVIQFNNWKHEQKTPKSIENLINLLDDCNSFSREGKPMVVTCYDGATASGLFVALSFVIDKIKLEQNCDICLAVRAIRNNRPQFVTDKRQFEFLYNAAVCYVDMFETYANFQ